MIMTDDVNQLLRMTTSLLEFLNINQEAALTIELIKFIKFINY